MGSPGGWRPTHDQELLLRACLVPGEAGLQAFHQWRAGLDLDTLDQGSYRLLPLLSHSLAARGLKDPRAATFRGVFRLSWYQNQLLLNQLAPLLHAFHHAGLPVMLLKGAALSLTHYRSPGLRPMDDVDLLVPRARVQDAVALLFAFGLRADVTPQKGFAAAGLLARAGWAPHARRQEEFSESYCSVRHAHAFRGRGGLAVDLHWSAFQDDCRNQADDGLWARAVSVEAHGATALVPAATDLFMHVCVHGSRWNAIPPVRWVADALTVAGSDPAGIDWELLLEEAERRRITLPLADTLGWLRERFALPLPVGVLARLRSPGATPFEQRRHRAETEAPGLAAGWLELQLLHRRWRELRATARGSAELQGFGAFLRHVLGMESYWQLPLYAAFETARRLRQRLIGSQARGRPG